MCQVSLLKCFLLRFYEQIYFCLVFVCSVFIVVLCMAGLLLRYIYRRLQRQQTQENIEKQKEIKEPAGTRGQHVQKIQVRGLVIPRKR